MRVKLQNNGTVHRCTFEFEDYVCNTMAFEALTEDDYHKLRNDPRLKYISFMRALCPLHHNVFLPYLTN